MKKFLVLGLILAVAGGAFAQLNWSGNFESGFGIQIPDPDADNSDPIFRIQGNTFEYTNRLNLNAAWTNADGFAGVNIGFRINDIVADSARQIGVQTAHAWINLLDGDLRLSVGREGLGGFGVGGDWNPSYDIATANTHFSAIYQGVENLNIGVTLRGTGILLENVGFSLGGNYTIPDTVRIGAAVNSRMSGTDRVLDLALGANILALADMGISRLGFSAEFTELGEDPSELRLSQGLTYDMDELQIGLNFRQRLGIGDAVKDLDPALRFLGWVSYKLSDIVTPRLDFGFGMATGLNSNYRKPGDFIRDGWTGHTATNTWLADGGVVGGDFDIMALSLAPNVTFNLGGGARLETGYIFNMDIENEVMYNAVYLTLRVEF